MSDIETCQWRQVCQVGDIPVLGARVLRRADADDIALFRNREDRVFAVVDRCPHKGGPLSAGLMHGSSVTCPLHSWVIDLDSGQAHAPDEGCVRTVPVKVDNDMVYLDLDAEG
jgi:nitrite reductase (NADH) small subunit